MPSKSVRRSPAAAKKGSVRPKAQRSSLTAKAYEALKLRILTGHFSPGQYLNETDIAESLEIGRTPVHQALQRLQLDGLVKVVPRKGVIIQLDTIDQVKEVLEARSAIEPLLVKQAASYVTNEDIADLENIVSRNTRTPSIDFYVEKDRAFHAKLISLARNNILGDFVRTLHERSLRYSLIQMWQSVGASERADEDHLAILEALRNRDGNAAMKAMRQHLDSVRGRLYLPMARAIA